MVWVCGTAVSGIRYRLGDIILTGIVADDSLGGDLAYALGLSVFAPFPVKPEWPLKLHGFLNLGKVVGYQCREWEEHFDKRCSLLMTCYVERSFGDNINNLYNSPNLSAGVGLLYRLDPVRVELNLALPLIGRKGEGWARGIGVGLGLEFL